MGAADGRARRAAGRAIAADADHARVAVLLSRRQVMLAILAEDEAELRQRGVALDGTPQRTPAEPRGDHRVPIAVAAARLGKSKKTLRRWAAASGTGWVSATGRWVIDLPALVEWRANPG